MAETTREFLVVYDYGMGGLWAVVHAHSAAEIVAMYPELTVMDERPEWMTDEVLAEIRQDESHNLHDQPHDLLEGLIAQRNKS
jgi:hypothetical protein